MSDLENEKYLLENKIGNLLFNPKLGRNQRVIKVVRMPLGDARKLFFQVFDSNKNYEKSINMVDSYYKEEFFAWQFEYLVGDESLVKRNNDVSFFTPEKLHQLLLKDYYLHTEKL